MSPDQDDAADLYEDGEWDCLEDVLEGILELDDRQEDDQ